MGKIVNRARSCALSTSLGVFVLLSVVAVSVGAEAEEYRIGNIVVSDPWAMASIGKTPNGAVYMTLSVKGGETDRLIKVETPVAEKAAVHTTIMEAGVMKMREVKAPEVAPSKPMLLRPGSLHIMLVGLKKPLRTGEVFPMTLNFEKAGRGTIEIAVKGLGETMLKEGEHHTKPNKARTKEQPATPSAKIPAR